MFIYQFNRLIRSRILWGSFAFIIALAFVGVPLAARLEQGGGNTDLAGRLGRQNVSREEFARTRFFLTGFGRQPDDSRSEEELDRETWQRLAALKTANTLGLHVGPMEVGSSIHRDPAFQVEGRFSPQHYRTLLERHLRLDPELYEEFTAERLKMRKLSDVLSAAVWVAPSELHEQISGMTDAFDVRYIVLSNRFVTADMDMDDNALRQYFMEHAEMFRQPERVAVRYAVTPVERFLEDVSVTREDILDYYEAHREDFRRETTNEVSEVAAFEDVRDEIEARLSRDDARFAAAFALTRMVDRVIRDAGPDAFELRAQAEGFQVQTTDLFSATQVLPNIDAGRAFVEAAFDLDGTRLDRRYSDAIQGRDYVYALAAYTNAPSSIPDFEAVRARVRTAALDAARREAFDEWAHEQRERIAERLAGGDDLDAAAYDLSLSVSSNFVFSVVDAYYGDAADIPHIDTLSSAVARLKPGELSQPEPLRQNALLAYVVDRQRGDAQSAAMLRPQLRSQIEQFRLGALTEDWARWNLEQAKLEDRMAMPRSEAEREAGY